MEEKISKFIELFQSLPDERQEWKIKHKLIDIIFIVIAGVIADCDDWEEIEWFAKLKIGWFKKHLELPNGIPSHDTMERTFSWIDADAFRKCFMEWVGLANKAEATGVIAIDGKTMRGAKDFSKDAPHAINAWFSENGLVLGQVFVNGKGSEMKAIPGIIEMLDVSGQIVTIDAAGTYKDIAETIASKKGDCVLALKANQPTLFEDVKLFFEDALQEKGHGGYKIESVAKSEKGHGRIERRTYYMTDEIDWLAQKAEWPGLKSIGMVKSRVENVQSGAVSQESRYFISSLPCGASRFAYAVRQHWGVESMHWP
jgi:predicted transposase YbfD/YdcC